MSSKNHNKRLEPLHVPHTDTEHVVDAVLSPVPDFMGVMLRDLAPRFFSLRTGLPVEVPVNKPARGMAFRPRTKEFPCNELAVVTGENSSSVKRIDLELQIGLIDLFMPRANAVAYSHTGRYMAAGSTDGTVRVWNLQNQDAVPAEIFCQKVSRHGVTRLQFNSTDDILFIVTARGELLHANVGNDKQPAHPYLLDNNGNAYDWDCYCVATHPHVPLVAFGGIGSDVIISSLQSRKIMSLKTNVGEFVRSMEFLPDTGQLLVVGREVEVFNLSPMAKAPAEYAIPATGRPLCAKQYGDAVFVVRA